MSRSSFVAVVVFVYIGLCADAVFGQNYPTRPIRVVTPPAGGGFDVAARLIADPLKSLLGQPLIMDNRPQSLVPSIAASAAADGYTLMFAGNDFWIAPLLRDSAPWNREDFVPISLSVRYPSILVLHPSVPANSVKDLIDLAKARPGVLNYASGAAGGPNHLAAELFKYMAGVDIMRIPYAGGGPALTSLIGGQTQVLFGSAGLIGPHLKSGRLNALAVTSLQPSPLAPGLPTMTAAGLPGYQSIGLAGFFGLAKTPVAVIKRLSKDIAQVVNGADLRDRLLNIGAEPAGSSAEEFAALIRSDVATWSKVIKAGGIREDKDKLQ
jgi:tripartite-type tricarboxylate transporter receptor subunit TctC